MKEMWMIFPSHMEAKRSFLETIPSLKTLRHSDSQELIAETDESRIIFISSLQKIQNFLAHRYDHVHIDSRVDQSLVIDQHGTTFRQLIESRKRTHYHVVD
jgi:hypothetical protein